MKVNITLDTEFESLEDLDKLATYVQELITKRRGQMGLPPSKPQTQPVVQQTPVQAGFSGHVRDTHEQTLTQQQRYADPFVDTEPIDLSGVTFGQEPYKTAQEAFRGPAEQPPEQPQKVMEQPRQQPSFSPQLRQQAPLPSSNQSNGATKTAGGCEVVDYEDLSDMMSKIFSGEKL